MFEERPSDADRRGAPYHPDYLKDELQAFIASLYFGKGLDMNEIVDEMKARFGEDFAAAKISVIKNEVRAACRGGRVIYVPGLDKEYANRLIEARHAVIEDRYKRSDNHRRTLEQQRKPTLAVDVVVTTEPRHIAERGAEIIKYSIIEKFKNKYNANDMHIGFAGGRTPSLTAQALASLLVTPDAWPDEIVSARPKKRLVFHSLVGSLNSDDPEVDPNAFLIYLNRRGQDSGQLPFNLSFLSLPAPGVVTWPEYVSLVGGGRRDGVGLIDDALERGKNLDIVVLSGGHWRPGENHRSAYNYLDNACRNSKKLADAWAKTVEALNEMTILGDLMWWPIAAGKPFRLGEDHLRVMSLIRVFDLLHLASPRPVSTGSSFRKKADVLLLLGPCSGPECRESKGRLLAGVLRMPRLPMTHLVVDSRSARDCINQLDGNASR